MKTLESSNLKRLSNATFVIISIPIILLTIACMSLELGTSTAIVNNQTVNQKDATPSPTIYSSTAPAFEPFESGDALECKRGGIFPSPQFHCLASQELADDYTLLKIKATSFCEKCASEGEVDCLLFIWKDKNMLPQSEEDLFKEEFQNSLIATFIVQSTGYSCFNTYDQDRKTIFWPGC